MGIGCALLYSNSAAQQGGETGATLATLLASFRIEPLQPACSAEATPLSKTDTIISHEKLLQRQPRGLMF